MTTNQPSLLTLRDIANLGPDDRTYYINGLVGEGQICMITAQPGAGKSYLMQLMSVVIAGGENWYDTFIAEQAMPVLYVLTEGSKWDLQERVEGTELLGYHSELALENWYTPENMVLDLTQGSIASRGTVQLLKLFVKLTGAKVVFIDSLYSSMAGDPSEGKSAQAVAKTLSELRQEFPEVAWVLIHHDHRERMDSDGNVIEEKKPYLGHVVLEGMCDQMWHYSKRNEASAKFTQIKGRSRKHKIDSFYVDLDSETGVLRPQGSATTNSGQQVRNFFKANVGKEIDNDMFEAWYKDAGLAESTAMDQRRNLVDSGMVEMVRRGVYRWKGHTLPNGQHLTNLTEND